MAESDWRVLVGAKPQPEARLELQRWLDRNGLTDPQIEPDLRAETTGSLDGIQRVRYSIRDGAWRGR